MYLSDAIEQGSLHTKKAIGAMFRGDGSCCALGAACVAVGIQRADSGIEALHSQQQLRRMFPVLNRPFPDSKDFDRQARRDNNTITNLDLIIHMNDDLDWDRIRIAEWLRDKGL